MDATGAGGDGDGTEKAAPEGPAEATTPPPEPAASLPPASASGAGAGTSGSGEKPVKRMMKTPYQLEVLEKTYVGSCILMDSSVFIFFLCVCVGVCSSEFWCFVD